MAQETELNDAQLLKRFKQGDETAFVTLVNRYRIPLFNYIYRLIGDKHNAEDLFQDVFVRVFNAISDYQEQGKFASWIFGIANNLAIDYLRKKGRRKSIFVDNNMPDSETNYFDSVPDLGFSPEDFIEQKELQEILKHAINQLPIAQRQVLLMREHSDLPFKEIAEILDCSINTVLGRMRYALFNLRNILQKQLKGEITHVLQEI